MTHPAPPNNLYDAGTLPKKRAKRKYVRKTPPPPLAPELEPTQYESPPAPDASAPEPVPAATPTPVPVAEPPPAESPALVAPKPARRTRRKPTVKVVLTGTFKGFHAFEPGIQFIPGVPVTVPNDGWIRAQINAKYLKEV